MSVVITYLRYVLMKLFVGNAVLFSYDQTWERLLDYYRSPGCKVEASAFPLQQQQTD